MEKEITPSAEKKNYQTPEFEKLGELVSDTLPGGSGVTEGQSGKNHPL